MGLDKRFLGRKREIIIEVLGKRLISITFQASLTTKHLSSPRQILGGVDI